MYLPFDLNKALNGIPVSIQDNTEVLDAVIIAVEYDKDMIHLVDEYRTLIFSNLDGIALDKTFKLHLDMSRTRQCANVKLYEPFDLAKINKDTSFITHSGLDVNDVTFLTVSGFMCAMGWVVEDGVEKIVIFSNQPGSKNNPLENLYIKPKEKPVIECWVNVFEIYGKILHSMKHYKSESEAKANIMFDLGHMINLQSFFPEIKTGDQVDVSNVSQVCIYKKAV